MTTFGEHVETWELLGKDDPLWAVVSHDDKRGNRWNIAEFLRTGEPDVARYRELLGRLKDSPPRFRHILDFGCGVGRLSRFWAEWAEKVTGVDVSSSMIGQAKAINADKPNVEFVHNAATDLARFSTNSFDLVFSHICLQHIPWPLVRGYLDEFARVCCSGGLVVFQLPSRRLTRSLAGVIRKSLVDTLPFGLDQTYRKLRHGSRTAYDVHYTPLATVLEACSKAGLSELLLASDITAGYSAEGFIYVFRKA